MERNLQIPSGNSTLAATLHTPEQTGSHHNEACPLIIICHGFIGSRIGVDRLFVKAARDLTESGFAVLRFDYGGCGESAGEYGEGGLDVLLSQTRDVIDYASGLTGIDPARISLIGHSLGGAVSMLTASADARIQSLVLWAAVARPYDDIVRIVGEEEYQEALLTGKTDHRGYLLSDRFFRSLNSALPLRQAKQFEGDVLLLHGNRDDVISVDSMFHYERELRLRRRGRCEAEVIVGGDHTFSTAASYQRLIGSTIHWLKGQSAMEVVAV